MQFWDSVASVVTLMLSSLGTTDHGGSAVQCNLVVVCTPYETGNRNCVVGERVFTGASEEVQTYSYSPFAHLDWDSIEMYPLEFCLVVTYLYCDITPV